MLYYFFQLCLMKMFQHRESECCCLHVCVSYRINSRYCLAIFALPLCCFSPESFECKLQISARPRLGKEPLINSFSSPSIAAYFKIQQICTGCLAMAGEAEHPLVRLWPVQKRSPEESASFSCLTSLFL